MKKIKIISVLLSVILCTNILIACQKTDVKKENYEKSVNSNETMVEKIDNGIALDVFPMDMMLSSGAGGWRTQITLKEDGTFVGDYYDSEMGMSHTDYDYTVNICEFSGKYEIIEKIDDYSYTFKFTEVQSEKDEGEQWIEDRIRYVSSGHWGVSVDQEYILYTDKTPIEKVSENLLVWWPYKYNYEEENIKTLMCYGLYNKDEEIAFFQLNF